MIVTARILLSRAACIRLLTAIQNSALYRNQDILTFTGFMDDGEVRQHVLRCFLALSDSDKRRVFEVPAGMFPLAEAA